ncbi:potassium transporter Kef [Halorubrum sp. JWXQ-INN 858]|uniref:cation:proton antiporter n=1 Tax=Halorubrum sp. JWXQ-INN 858 TaxID=2690782 RepID=UPI00135C55B3|nr:cation:proton antiporter [Halorubrum sp. JWXQ-INN 858]MWV65299.1 potassium transporter Kef [Halorubrum sp. JWXQ-INN 858]
MVLQEAFVTDFALIIVTATVIGYLAKQTGQPTIIAYILTGLILGPVFLDVVTEEGLVELMAELGLGFLLFLLGIKMRFSDIKDILRPIVNIAVLQTVLQTALAFGVAWVLGFDLTETIVIALATVFGATPIIVKILTDKDEITSLPGKIDVGVLIVQDIYLVIVLALFSADELTNATEVGVTLATILVMMSFIGLFSLLSSRYFLPTLFRRIADNKDVFFVIGIAWAFLFIAVTEHLELSVEVGAFLAGISLAQLPYSKELEERISPITDFFILVFFASIGLQIAADDLTAYWVEAIVASAVLMVGNFWIMFYLIDREGFTVETSFLGSINMIQVSEFSLVVGALAVTQGYIGTEVLGYLSLMALLTMSLSTYVINYNHAIYARVEPFFRRWQSDEQTDVELREFDGHAVVVGFDGVTEGLLPLLADRFDDVVVIDRNVEHVEELEGLERYETVYGDFRHGEIRKAANLSDAAFVLSSTVQAEINERLLTEVDDDATVVVEAETAAVARRLYDAGADYVVMSTQLTADHVAERLRTVLRDGGTFGDIDTSRGPVRDGDAAADGGERDV